MTVFDPDYERARAEELFRTARAMTALGLPGEDPDDPKVANFLNYAINATDGDEAAIREYSLKNWGKYR
ncbi:MAG: hypothetical protein ACT6QM_05935 [Brevundimonas mediterranea]|uniref:hypothetical protein n=1 Tax=Brevundimonas mediterranea TaxID=74329 RepID=UPI004033F074